MSPLEREDQVSHDKVWLLIGTARRGKQLGVWGSKDLSKANNLVDGGRATPVLKLGQCRVMHPDPAGCQGITQFCLRQPRVATKASDAAAEVLPDGWVL